MANHSFMERTTSNLLLDLIVSYFLGKILQSHGSFCTLSLLNGGTDMV